jgi:hypothetical protein
MTGDIKNKDNNSKDNNIIDMKDTLIIIDWDDTLFPTSWVMKNKINMNRPEIRTKYKDFFLSLDRLLYMFLNKCLTYGNTIIITNAMPLWITNSSDVLKNTSYILNRIPVISAREKYQNKTNNMMDWKKYTFKDEIDKLKNNKFLNIISIGDAEYEYNALVDLNKSFPNLNKLLKSVKLLKNPNYETLLDEIDVLKNSLHYICQTKQHLDMNFEFHYNLL